MKKNIAKAALALSCIFLFTACSNAGDKKQQTSSPSSNALQADSAYHKITAEESKKMMDKGNVTILDVRTEEEYAEKHIPDAVLIPVGSIEENAQEILTDKDEILLVYCRTGKRSKQASEKLIELGYTQVYDFGGITDWPYETESGEQQ